MKTSKGGTSVFMRDDSAMQGNQLLIAKEVAIGRAALAVKEKAVETMSLVMKQRTDPSFEAPVDYFDAQSLFDVLIQREQPVRLLSARWLCQLTKNEHGGLRRRQDLPEEAFISGEHLMASFKAAPKRGNKPKRAPVIAISHFWDDTPDGQASEEETGEAADRRKLRRTVGPDPKGEQLALVGRMLREHLHLFKGHGYTDVGVYIEWGSCHQPPRSLSGAIAYQKSREYIELWFAHALTTCCLCVDTPADTPAYWERGMCAFEGRLAWMLKDPHDESSEWAYVYELLDFASTRPSVRPPPPATGALEAPHGELCELPFAFDGEKGVATARMREVVDAALGAVTELNYANHGWGDEEGDLMARTLSMSCPGLERLHLSGNDQITMLPEDVGALLALKTLFLHGCRGLTTLPESIGNLSALRTLYLTSCASLTQLPESVCALHELRELDLTRCSSLTHLPSRLGDCKRLNSLMLTGCIMLKAIPERLPPLTGLYATGCTSLHALPERLTAAAPLMTLSPRRFDGIKLHLEMTLEVTVSDKSPLRDLFLRGCTRFTQLPLTLSSLASVRHLDLSYCTALRDVPEEFGAMPNLVKVNLARCEALEALPPLDGLVSLEELDLTRCTSLTVLPEGLGELTRLRTLVLEGCSLLPLDVRMSQARPPVKLLQRTHDAAEAAGLLPDTLRR